MNGRARRVAIAIAGVVLFAVGFLPLFAGPGYEAALAAGLVLPGLAAVATALDVRRATTPMAAFSRGVANGALLALVGFAVTWIHGVRAGFCDALEGSEYFWLGPGAGAVLGGVWGAAVGVALKGRGSRFPRVTLAALALAGPIAGVVTSFGRFYMSPMVFAFDPFVGFFAGTLYDSIITGLGRLVTYRAGTLATVLAAGAFAAWLSPSPVPTTPARDDDLAPNKKMDARGARSPEKKWGALAVAIVCVGASVVHSASGTTLGHYQTAASIRAALGETVYSRRCDLVLATGTPAVEARALGKDCDGHLDELERYLGVTEPHRITVFVFANADQKGALMGAASTYIAKPWRHEIYIQRAGFPHPVMRHELAHVVAGEFGRGPFHVAGPLFALIPDPGRIEGVAVAAAPHDEDLSLGEWTKAMADLSILPPLSRVFKLSFLGEPSSRAYVVAGAFIEWLAKTHGMDAVRRWYGGASLADAAGKSLDELDVDFRASLERLAVGPDVLAVARARFDQPAIFGRRCPHVIDRIAEEANGALGGLDTVRAVKLFGDVLALDPHDLGARFGLAQCDLRAGNEAAARARYEALSKDPSLGAAMRARADEALGDLALVLGEGGVAKQRYDDVAHAVVDADRLRALDVKRYAADGHGERPIALHLIGDLRIGREPTLAASALGAWAAEEPKLGLAEYLLSRTYLGAGRWELAAESLDRALLKELPLESVRRQAHKDRLVIACALADAPRVLVEYAAWSAIPSSRAPDRADVADLVERCTGHRPPIAAVTIRMDDSPAATPNDPGAATAPASPPGPAGTTANAPADPPASALLDPPHSNVCPAGMLKIPAGDAWIGNPRGKGADDQWPRFRTRLPSFCMDATEVTVSAYAACAKSGKCTAAVDDRVTCTSSGRGRDDAPVNCVDWFQADAFCRTAGARLPTETEWEYAASGGDDRSFSWGDEPPEDRVCWRTNRACKVASFAAGAFGLFDMTGNVWEWTADWYGDYPWPPMNGTLKVYRGGSWSRRFDKWMKVRLRDRANPRDQGAHLGFRCAATLSSEPCPFGRGANGECFHGVLDADCRPGRPWNGVRCAKKAEQGCDEGRHEVPGHGCLLEDAELGEPASAKTPGGGEESDARLASVEQRRAPEFDADCRQFQTARPTAYRFAGGSHEERNHAESSLGCKNRDVGVGWNSACCP